MGKARHVGGGGGALCQPIVGLKPSVRNMSQSKVNNRSYLYLSGSSTPLSPLAPSGLVAFQSGLFRVQEDRAIEIIAETQGPRQTGAGANHDRADEADEVRLHGSWLPIVVSTAGRPKPASRLTSQNSAWRSCVGPTTLSPII